MATAVLQEIALRCAFRDLLPLGDVPGMGAQVINVDGVDVTKMLKLCGKASEIHFVTNPH
jgi:hypothetical protein